MSNPWVHNRILDFFNHVTTPSQIVRFVEDDPSNGDGKGIGKATAQRIIERRDSLTFGRFTDRKELDDIKGLGPDKWKDLEYTFGVPAAQAFEKSLFEEQVLLDNWTLLHYDWAVDTQEAFLALIQDETAFRNVVRTLAERAIAETAGESAETCAELAAPLMHQYIDAYHNSSQEGALAFAVWFYRFSADNWFSFEEMLEHTDRLMTYHATPLWDMEIRFFKGFNNHVFTQLICPPDLPVLVNFPEQTISIWVSGLAD
ncbi:MAG: helix-hairpin-helix domain-containing protein [Saprospiraceae bacterium]|jgi:hypothetical protein